MKRLLTALLLVAMQVNLHAQDLKLTRENIPEIIAALTPEEKVDLVVGCGAGWGNPDAKFPGQEQFHALGFPPFTLPTDRRV